MASLNPNCWSSQVRVYAEDTHSRDQRHASPTLTFVFNVVRRYQSDTHMDTFETVHDSTHEFNCPLDLFRSSTPLPVSDGVVSGMLDAVDIPFLLDNIFWGSRPPRRRLPNRGGGWIYRTTWSTRFRSSRTGWFGSDGVTHAGHDREPVRSEQRAIEEYTSWFGDERAIIVMLEQQATERYLSWFGEEGDIERVMRESEAEAAAVFRVAPAAKASVEALEKLGYDEVVSVEMLTCVVCLEELNGRSQLTRMPCSHLFHGECIEKWLQNHHSCPICRFELPIEIN
ncbi:43kDa postsynaptic protein [Parasponia andersonii]|uniref:RING-type E3 ubiquitin transferase n=1 Tax=Parasponia andersonii TaxID=3476 RepID=A0A2P5C8N7_PARAD|nr:43kDa postsynaptic protein [Parasponia andersonii]